MGEDQRSLDVVNVLDLLLCTDESSTHMPVTSSLQVILSMCRSVV